MATGDQIIRRPFAVKLLFVNLQFHVVAAGILRLHCLWIVDRIDDVHDGGFKTCLLYTSGRIFSARIRGFPSIKYNCIFFPCAAISNPSLHYLFHQ